MYDHVVLVVGAISIKHKKLPFLSIISPEIRDQPHPPELGRPPREVTRTT